jgi:hypothetical protein
MRIVARKVAEREVAIEQAEDEAARERCAP